MPSYQELARRLAPTVLRGPFGQKLMSGTIGRFLDGLSESARQAVRASWILNGSGPADGGLEHLGAETGLKRYPSESDSAYQSRLDAVWDYRAFSGTGPTLIDQIQNMFGITAEIIFNSDWNWDGDADNWSRFWVVLHGTPWSRWTYGTSQVWGGGQVWGSTATEDDVRAIRELVHRWKSGHFKCEFIIPVFDEVTWAAEPPDGTWDEPTNRSTSATYWEG